MSARPAGADAASVDLDRLPRLAAVLHRSEEFRRQRIGVLAHGARLRGLDELLAHLDAQALTFAQTPALERIAFLVRRAAADFETAVESALAGYLAVSIDAMRDVMEIENLLLDFAVKPTHIDDWLSCDAKALRTRYSAAEVRSRLHRAGEGRFATSAEAPDYRARSQALHVGPHPHPLTGKGFSAEAGWNGDAAFWEIFEHAVRLLRAIRRLTDRCDPGGSADTVACVDLPLVDDAHQRTQEMQTMYLALLQDAATSSADDAAERT